MKTFITAIALTFASIATMAQEATPAPEIDNFVSTRSRAEVRAEVLAAMARGDRLSYGEVTRAPEFERFVSQRSRGEVHAEVLAAIANGERLSYGEAGPEQFPRLARSVDQARKVAARNAAPKQ